MLVKRVAVESAAYAAAKDLVNASADRSFSLHELARRLGVVSSEARSVWDDLIERDLVVCFDDYIGEPTGAERSGLKDHALTMGATYEVLSVEYESYRLFTDRPDHGPVLVHCSLFRVVDPVAPDCWVSEIDEDGYLHRGPGPWLEPGYFEDVHDRGPAARALFRDQLKSWYPATYERVKASL